MLVGFEVAVDVEMVERHFRGDCSSGDRSVTAIIVEVAVEQTSIHI